MGTRRVDSERWRRRRRIGDLPADRRPAVVVRAGDRALRAAPPARRSVGPPGGRSSSSAWSTSPARRGDDPWPARLDRAPLGARPGGHDATPAEVMHAATEPHCSSAATARGRASGRSSSASSTTTWPAHAPLVPRLPRPAARERPAAAHAARSTSPSSWPTASPGAPSGRRPRSWPPGWSSGSAARSASPAIDRLAEGHSPGHVHGDARGRHPLRAADGAGRRVRHVVDRGVPGDAGAPRRRLPGGPGALARDRPVGARPAVLRHGLRRRRPRRQPVGRRPGATFIEMLARSCTSSTGRRPAPSSTSCRPTPDDATPLQVERWRKVYRSAHAASTCRCSRRPRPG